VSLYLRLGAYALGALLLFGAGFKVAAWRGEGALEALRAADAQDRANGEQAVRLALQGQLKQAQATSDSNAQTMVRLANENAQIAADRDANVALARRLLARQARSTPGSDSAAKTPDRSQSPRPSGAGGDDSIAGLLADTADECDRNADRLDALIAEVKRQL